MVAHYIATQSLLYLCEATDKNTGVMGGDAVVGSGGGRPDRVQ